MNKEQILKAVADIERQAAVLRGILEQPTEQTTDFITIQQAAKMLGITVNGVYRLTHLKKIPYYRPTGKRVYFKIEDINGYLSSNRVQSEQEQNNETIKAAFV